MPAKKEAIDRYKMVFDLSPQAIVILDKKGKLIDVNGRLYEWLGYTKEEVLGKNIIKLPYLTKISKLKVAERFSKRILGKKVEPYELDFISKTGEKKVGLVTARVIKDSSGKIVEDLVMISDITERKKIEEDLENKLTELRKMNDVMINREIKMVELKEKLRKMKK